MDRTHDMQKANHADGGLSTLTHTSLTNTRNRVQQQGEGKRSDKNAGKDFGGQKPGQSGGNGNGSGGGMRPARGILGVVSLLMLAMMLVLATNLITSQAKTIPVWKEFQTLVENKALRDIEIHADGVYAKTTQFPGEPGREVEVAFKFVDAASRVEYTKRIDQLTGGDYKEVQPSVVRSLLLFLLPIVLIIGIMWFLVTRGLRSAGAGPGGMLGSFGKSRHRMFTKENTGVTFNDVAGIDEAKDEVTEIIEFLKNPKKFTKLGGRIPRGVLLVGEPGCGKTLLAKAIAGEAEVPFFSISGSDFVEMFVGVGASRVRDLFKQAKESAPCIIFLDEIDAVGRRRGGGFTTGGHDEREQTLNAILVEMDGFATGDGVIVVAATNRSDVLDPALTRPGRFDRQIVVPRPDVKGRMDILRVHAKKVKMGPDVDLERVARATPMFSGADLAALINEAAIAATLHNKDFIEQEDLEEARDKVRYGRARKSMHRERDDNRLTAYHEAGHAVLQALLTDADPLHKVTIIPRGGALGATFSLPDKDRMGYGLKWIRATMRVLCGGRIAEEKATGDVCSGAAMDIAMVTDLARNMILEWGMSEKLGFVRYAPVDTRDMQLPETHSDHTSAIIDNEIRRLADEAYADAKRILEENWDKVVAVAEALLKYETLAADEVRKLLRGEPLGKPTVSDLLAEEKRKDVSPTIKPPPEPESGIPSGVFPKPA